MFIEVTNAELYEDTIIKDIEDLKILLRKDKIVRVHPYGTGTRIQSELAGEFVHQDVKESYEDICLKLGVKSGN